MEVQNKTDTPTKSLSFPEKVTALAQRCKHHIVDALSNSNTARRWHIGAFSQKNTDEMSVPETTSGNTASIPGENLNSPTSSHSTDELTNRARASMQSMG